MTSHVNSVDSSRTIEESELDKGMESFNPDDDRVDKMLYDGIVEQIISEAGD